MRGLETTIRFKTVSYTDYLIMVEELTVVVIFGVSIMALLYYFHQIKGTNRGKSRVKTSTDAINDQIMQNVKQMQESYGLQLENLKADLKHTQGQYSREKKRREMLEDDDGGEGNNDQSEMNFETMEFDKELARPILEKWGMNADALDNPALQGLIKEKLKGNEEVLTMLGILRPKGSVQTTSTVDSQSSIDEAIKALDKSGRVA